MGDESEGDGRATVQNSKNRNANFLIFLGGNWGVVLDKIARKRRHSYKVNQTLNQRIEGSRPSRPTVKPLIDNGILPYMEDDDRQ